MMFNKEAFKLMAMGDDAYPFNEIRATRQGFIVSWLLLETHQPRSLRFRAGSKVALHTSGLDKTTVTHLIVSGQGLPLPQDYCEVLDCTEWWGRGLSPQWYETVLEMMHLDLKQGQKVDRECLFKNCISFHVNEIINNTAHGISRAWITLCWHNFFDNTYMYDTKDFFACAVRSIQFTKEKIAHNHHLAMLENNNNYVEDDNDEDNYVPITRSAVPSTPQSSPLRFAIVSPDDTVS